MENFLQKCADLEEQTRKYEVFSRECREKAMKKLFQEFWYDRILNEVELTDNWIPDCEKEEFQKYIGKRNKGGRYKYAMISINPKVTANPGDFIKKVLKSVKKKYIERFYYCYEFTGELTEEENGNMHVHIKIWIDKKKNSYEIKREFYNTFKELVGSKQCVNIRYSNRDDCFEEYIRGWKKKTPKECMGCTKRGRLKLGLLDVYGTSSNKCEYVKES